ncbi:MAG: 2,3-bisphosphoglycerate-independent phosphoglycerate mutase [Bacteroidales bacterium]|jgi:2,3-bisphosphoglycerate-independent phosphoglycerate mutase|nr:2,3-bisphosphoglycerate-independent phosphoglycerate mutase [Bacteroidales bacterium]OQC43897.1 MAG: 2,3-bisphosphoglycerate-independent phosphoglycerate mutase [Bacteroidetes bacterium ADurb.Bin028]HNY43732.1 2,3-bisphosphoglycerate-independent phosphoglycerate mutase [Bacteroidales bacterium]HOD87758.1 2,3-bisphosphoglycerate-independent phosphoglycerate mutase [Bacteroidales bacterium]
MTKQKVVLMILDGWGKGNGQKADVISNAKTPNYDKFIKNFPNSELLTDGENVGLPKGQMGNSEVGHLNIGAGRVVYQDLVKINKEIESGKFFQNPVLLKAFKYAKENDKQVHLLGLVSNGGVHSTEDHLLAIVKLSDDLGLKKTFIHALTDGRDTDPKSGIGFLKKVTDALENSNVKLASLVGRYYTMDRDKRWERVKKGYDLMLEGIGKKSTDILKSMQESYDNDITDEFIEPIVMTDKDGNPVTKIQSGDVVICFNFRTDRLRQITTVLTQKDMPEHGMKTLDLEYFTMTRYDESFKGINVIYEKDNLNKTLGEVIAKNGLSQLRIAETEKYAHVSFFFSGGREEKFENETRILIPSQKVATYDLKPEMSAPEVKKALMAEIEKNIHNLIVVNFANCDMVGHTGVYDAIVKAVETVDTAMGEVVELAIKNDYQILIIADHGNADNALNDDGTPNTAHSLNPVPCILINSEYKKIENGVLADVAPTILKMMNLAIPSEMTGKILV